MEEGRRLKSVTNSVIAGALSLSMVGAFAAAGGLGSAGSAFAKGKTAGSTTPCKPGNGFGDKNHCHLGPPGRTTSSTTSSGTSSNTSTATTTTTTTDTPTTTTTTGTGTSSDTTTTTTGTGTSSDTSTATTTTTGSTTTCKPGNGFGDKNHCHSGPPGKKK